MDKKIRKDVFVWTFIACSWGFLSFGHFCRDNYFWCIAFTGLAIVGVAKVIIMHQKYKSK